MNQGISQGTVTKLAILGLLIIAMFSIKPLLLGSAKPVQLVAAPALSGEISQAFSSDAATLPTVGKDFSMEHIHYFENKQWVVVNTYSMNRDTGGDGLVVLQQKHGMYSAVLGPGTAFPRPVVDSFPADVSKYLDDLGVIYDPVY